MLLVISAIRCTSQISKLRSVRQEYKTGVDGPYARTQRVYEVRYDFDRFTNEQYEAYRLGRIWPQVFAFAFFVEAGYGGTLALIGFFPGF